MSYRVKNLTIENGFARNPDRVYYEEYFDSLPQNFVSFTLTASGNTDDHVFQPANTFLTGAYVIGKSGSDIVLAGSSDVGLSLSHTGVQAVGSGNMIAGNATNVLEFCKWDNYGGNNIFASFEGIINGIDSYTSTETNFILKSNQVANFCTNHYICSHFYCEMFKITTSIYKDGFQLLNMIQTNLVLNRIRRINFMLGIFLLIGAHNNPISNGGLKTIL